MTRSDISIAIRLFIYLALQTGTLALYVFLVDQAELGQLGSVDLIGLLREDQWLEWSQISLLTLLAALSATALRPGRPALHRLFVAMSVIALFRELDSFLGDILFEDSHRIGMVAGAAGAAAVVWMGRRELPSQIAGFLRRPGLYLMVWGFTLVTIYSQLFGQREIWDFFAHEEIANLAKRFVEEGLEFMGYLVIACGVFEERFFGLRASNSTTPSN